MAKTLELIIALLISIPAAYAQEDMGDLCAIRPDLCDEGSTPEPEVEQARPVRRVKPATKHQRKVQKQRRKVRAARKRAARMQKPAERGCREAGKPYNLDNVDLPICGSVSLAEQAPTDEVRAIKRRVRRSPASSIDADAYMRANANHPAFARRNAERQKAFQEPAPRATASVPQQDVSTASTDAAPAAPSAPPGQAPVAGH